MIEKIEVRNLNQEEKPILLSKVVHIANLSEMTAAVRKAGEELGPGYMLDPENDAVVAVIEDLAHPLPEFKNRPTPPVPTEDFE